MKEELGRLEKEILQKTQYIEDEKETASVLFPETMQEIVMNRTSQPGKINAALSPLEERKPEKTSKTPKTEIRGLQ